jgi:hypothetical protein
MPVMRSTLVLALLLSLVACKDKHKGEARRAPADAGPPVEVKEFDAIDKQTWGLKIRAAVPAGWVERSPGAWLDQSGKSETMINFGVACDQAPCNKKTLPAQVAPIIDGALRKAAQLNIDPAYWDGGLPQVTVLERGELPGGLFVAYKVVPPPGLPGAPVEGLRAVCAKYRDGDEFIAVATVKAEWAEEQRRWPVLLDACKRFEIIGKVIGL